MKRLLTLNANLAGLHHDYTVLLQTTLDNNSNGTARPRPTRHNRFRRLFRGKGDALTISELEGRLRWIGEWKRVVEDVAQGLGGVVGIIGAEHHDDGVAEWKGERLVEDGERFVAWIRR